MSSEKVKVLEFSPLWGLKNPHMQTIMAGLTWSATEPPSYPLHIVVGGSDVLSCEVSTPSQWKKEDKTVVMLHGLGGSHASMYLVRLCRKLYDQGLKVVRVNLRNCGSGVGLSHLPYHAGNSPDLLAVLKALKTAEPQSPLILAGFSLGANILLKLLGELSEEANAFAEKAIAVCPPFDLSYTRSMLATGVNQLYERYYLYYLCKQSENWTKSIQIRSLLDYDEKVTAVQWGFENAEDYYAQCSSKAFLEHIRIPCHLLFAADDPIIDYKRLPELNNPFLEVLLSPHGGHMGFFSVPSEEHGCFWLDRTVLQLIHTGVLTK